MESLEYFVKLTLSIQIVCVFEFIVCFAYALLILKKRILKRSLRDRSLYSCFTLALLMLYSCFTLTLLLLYSCFTHALLLLCLCFTDTWSYRSLYSCFTHALLMLCSCFTHALLMLYSYRRKGLSARSI